MQSQLLKGTRVLFNDVTVANNFLARLKGLLFKDGLTEQEALCLTPCNAVHTLGMRFPIDVAFLNKDNIVTKIVPEIGKRKATSDRRAHKVIECSAGLLNKLGVEVGDELSFKNL
ncbi:DUF192 domain-containing protein [Corallincola platygyrae]|uniref:DUF192 domain-containing protein n=1 Tax=Corallincola platygyrae TaxID=1193278 RepID=A0ABW4XP20_9GAMM